MQAKLKWTFAGVTLVVALGYNAAMEFKEYAKNADLKNRLARQAVEREVEKERELKNRSHSEAQAKEAGKAVFRIAPRQQ